MSPSYAKVYVYELPDGSKLITDQRSYKKGYRLKNTYTTTPYRSSKGGNRPYYAAPVVSQYDALIVTTALRHEQEPAFVKAVIHIESAFDRFALSRAGAMGLMQLMPNTAAQYQLADNHYDPTLNVDAGVRHLKDLMQQYENDKKLVLAAYNAGAGAVKRYGGIPPYPETQTYVKKVLNLYTKYKKII